MADTLQLTKAVPVAALPVPERGWRRAINDSLLVGAATFVSHLVGAGTSLALRALLDPAYMGIWQTLKLLLSYGNYASLGASKGACRELAVATGGRDMGRAQTGLNVAFTINTLSSLVYALVLATCGCWLLAYGSGPYNGAWSIGLLAVGALAVVQRYVTFRVTILRTRQAFAATARLSVLEALVSFTVCTTATWLWGLYGLFGATLVVLVGSLIFVERHAEDRLRRAWNTREAVRLIGIGGPILLGGVSSSLFRSVDKLMILGYLSEREFQLGCYSVSLMVTVQLYGLANVLSMVMGPRYGQHFGRTGSRRDVARLAARASELQGGVLTICCAMALLLAPPVIATILPAYRSGLTALPWLIPGIFALCLALPAKQYLIAVGLERRVLRALVIAIMIAIVGNHVALVSGFGLQGVGAATTIGHVAYLALLLSASFWGELSLGERWRYAACVLLPGVLMVSLSTALYIMLPSEDIDWPIVAAWAAVLALVWGGLVAVIWQKSGWSLAWRDDG